MGIYKTFLSRWPKDKKKKKFFPRVRTHVQPSYVLLLQSPNTLFSLLLQSPNTLFSLLLQSLDNFELFPEVHSVVFSRIWSGMASRWFGENTYWGGLILKPRLGHIHKHKEYSNIFFDNFYSCLPSLHWKPHLLNINIFYIGSINKLNRYLISKT